MTSPLTVVALATTARASARDAYAEADANWRAAVRDACEANSLAEVAEVAGVHRSRVQQVRDGRR